MAPIKLPTSALLLLALLLAGCATPGTHGVSVRDAWLRLTRPGPHSPQGSSSSSSSSGAAHAAEVHSLPGHIGNLPSRHFAGRIAVDDATQRQLYYYLVTAESSAPKDDSPLVVWLTGGPGCSSMDAFTYEHGPFTFSAPAAEAQRRPPVLRDIQLAPNPWSWSKVVHMLYIDSPAGAGFSYTPGQQGPYHTDDHATIEDLVAFLTSFFEDFPDLQSRPMYIAAESYGGVYAPLLAQRLLAHNRRLAAAQPPQPPPQQQPQRQPFNLVGYVVGNAVTDDGYDGRGQVAYAFSHGLIDDDARNHVLGICEEHGWRIDEEGDPCSDALDAMATSLGPINKYDVTQPCHSGPAPPAPTLAAAAAPAAAPAWRRRPAAAGPAAADTASRASSSMSPAGAGASSSSSSRGGRRGGRLQHTISCADRRYALVYFNSPAVRRALHAPRLEESGRWEPCSDVLQYRHTAGSMIPVHQELLAAGLRALVLSGDQDFMVPFTGSRAWAYDLGLPQAHPWHSWHVPGDSQVAGYAVSFEQSLEAGQQGTAGASAVPPGIPHGRYRTGGLTFATVKGAGHMVPQSRPAASLALLQAWLNGTLHG